MINWLFLPLEAGLAAALNAVLEILIGKVLKFSPIRVFTLPKISFTLAGKTINIAFDKEITSSKNSMLIVASQLKVN